MSIRKLGRLATLAGPALLPACGSVAGQSIQPGEWEVTTTRPGIGGAKGVSQTTRHCLSAEDARHPSLQALVGASNPGDTWKQALVGDGSVSVETKVDTPDRSVRRIPVRIQGGYGARQFDFEERITFLGYDVVSSFVGRRVGDCP